MRVGDPDPCRQREQLLQFGDAGHADVDRQGQPFGASRGEPVEIATGSKQSCVVMYWANSAFARSASSSRPSAMNA